MFRNFGVGPMTLNRMGSEGIVRLEGASTAGSSIQVEIAGEASFQMGDDRRTYGWSLAHTVPVVGAN